MQATINPSTAVSTLTPSGAIVKPDTSVGSLSVF